MDIGILGGSFDPIHNGHLYMAKSAHDVFNLSQVWLMPAGHSPNKNEGRMTGAFDRFQMCELAAAAYDWLSVSRLELDSKEKSYTYRTLEKLTEQYPKNHFFFIMGGDSLDYFESWMHPEIIAKLCTILVIPRNQFDMPVLDKKIKQLKELFFCDIHIVLCDKYPISSTEIRERLSRGELMENMIPSKVFSYIQEHGLYQ